MQGSQLDDARAFVARAQAAQRAVDEMGAGRPPRYEITKAGRAALSQEYFPHIAGGGCNCNRCVTRRRARRRVR